MKILGIDPGLEVTGFACIQLSEDFDFHNLRESIILISHGMIKPPPQQPMEEKLKYIHSNVKKLLAEIKPDVVAIEEIYSHTLHPKTGLKMGHVKGVVELAVSQAGIRSCKFASSKVKRILTGRGNATKQQIARVIAEQFVIKNLDSHHESDAVAVALAYVFNSHRKACIS